VYDKRLERARKSALRELQRVGERIDHDDPNRFVSKVEVDGKLQYYAARREKGRKGRRAITEFAHADVLLKQADVACHLVERVQAAFTVAERGMDIEPAKKLSGLQADFSVSLGAQIKQVEAATILRDGAQFQRSRGSGNEKFDHELVKQRVADMTAKLGGKTKAVKAVGEQADMPTAGSIWRILRQK